ncbi:hypothetical protein TNIN_69561 [Trichonephila inaurata madagascariensis]|uniref:Uncharacterized protein n=1 Tax=Trichonephila inaurata madagascariensis TaxID=2747483 RepID=A0A8X6WRB1_9ARAC|nr:hypothetical protein TNIN_69561 [Trichonephila inaurata madagascariensis]
MPYDSKVQSLSTKNLHYLEKLSSDEELSLHEECVAFKPCYGSHGGVPTHMLVFISFDILPVSQFDGFYTSYGADDSGWCG